MVNSDDVLLLRPAPEESGTEISGRRRPFDQIREHEVVHAVILTCAGPVDRTALERLRRQIPPLIEAAEGTMLTCLVSEPSVNTFPALPIHEGAHVLVWLAGFRVRGGHGRGREAA